MPYEAIYETSQLKPGEITGYLIFETQMCGTINYYSAGRNSVPTYKVDLYAGNDRTLRVYVKDDDLNVIDLTGATAVLTCKKTKSATATIFTKSTAVAGEGQIGAADEGEIFFFLLPADTALLEDQYVYDVKVTLSNGKAYTVVEGIFNILEPVG